jgi:hypothetical protein
MSLRAPSLQTLVVAAVLLLATLGSFGPHVLMLGYRVAGTKPPATLLFFCPLHQLGDDSASHGSQALVIHAKPVQ